ncbi:hypothetical protein CIL03_11385 [Virgibacillus indicus]|uniref:NERD domain-containing protein n=1 Tax=Virgibacillus indicus TaxID=2024554 RepID=A0A265N895_9BACI|nr:nuclease-related domain-containing protein [Virgibacillus indicus]OZU88250.1 hypothetical protein CIL03_11385 [Virgibacillus indicus]
MIIRRRTKPLVLQKYDATVPRLRPNFPQLQEVQREQAVRTKGFEGEKAVDYHIDFLAAEATILHDVCLTVMGKSFQIDTLVNTPHAIFPVESKNYSGAITFDTVLRQMIRDDGRKETGFNYPVTQADLQKFKLQMWLQERNFPDIPIYPFIAISDPATIIKVKGDDQELAKTVAHGAHIPGMILAKNREYAEKHAKIDDRKIGNAILRECREFDIDIIKKHNIKASDLMPGVACLVCGVVGMKRIHGNWECGRCFNRSKTAHHKTIEDYLLVVKPWITNTDCMQFLNIKSRSAATRILQSSGLIYEKKYKRWVKG